MQHPYYDWNTVIRTLNNQKQVESIRTKLQNMHPQIQKTMEKLIKYNQAMEKLKVNREQQKAIRKLFSPVENSQMKNKIKRAILLSKIRRERRQILSQIHELKQYSRIITFKHPVFDKEPSEFQTKEQLIYFLNKEFPACLIQIYDITETSTEINFVCKYCPCKICVLKVHGKYIIFSAFTVHQHSVKQMGDTPVGRQWIQILDNQQQPLLLKRDEVRLPNQADQIQIDIPIVKKKKLSQTANNKEVYCTASEDQLVYSFKQPILKILNPSPHLYSDQMELQQYKEAPKISYLFTKEVLLHKKKDSFVFPSSQFLNQKFKSQLQFERKFNYITTQQIKRMFVKRKTTRFYFIHCRQCLSSLCFQKQSGRFDLISANNVHIHSDVLMNLKPSISRGIQQLQKITQKADQSNEAYLSDQKIYSQQIRMKVKKSQSIEFKNFIIGRSEQKIQADQVLNQQNQLQEIRQLPKIQQVRIQNSELDLQLSQKYQTIKNDQNITEMFQKWSDGSEDNNKVEKKQVLTNNSESISLLIDHNLENKSQEISSQQKDLKKPKKKKKTIKNKILKYTSKKKKIEKDIIRRNQRYCNRQENKLKEIGVFQTQNMQIRPPDQVVKHQFEKIYQQKIKIFDYPPDWFFQQQFQSKVDFVAKLENLHPQLFKWFRFNRKKLYKNKILPKNDMIHCKKCVASIIFKQDGNQFKLVKFSNRHDHRFNTLWVSKANIQLKSYRCDPTIDLVHDRGLQISQTHKIYLEHQPKADQNYINEQLEGKPNIQSIDNLKSDIITQNRKKPQECFSIKYCAFVQNLQKTLKYEEQIYRDQKNELQKLIEEYKILTAVLQSNFNLEYEVFMSPQMQQNYIRYGDSVSLIFEQIEWVQKNKNYQFIMITGFDCNQEVIIMAVMIVNKLILHLRSLIASFFSITNKYPDTIKYKSNLSDFMKFTLKDVAKLFNRPFIEQNSPFDNYQNKFIGYSTSLSTNQYIDSITKKQVEFSKVSDALKQIILFTKAQFYKKPPLYQINLVLIYDDINFEGLSKQISSIALERFLLNYSKISEIECERIGKRILEMGQRNSKQKHQVSLKKQKLKCTCNQYERTRIACCHLINYFLMQQQNYIGLIHQRWRVGKSIQREDSW